MGMRSVCTTGLLFLAVPALAFTAELTVEQNLSTASRPGSRNESCAECIDLRDSPTAGDPEAKHVLIEFCDYQCSYCATHQTEVYPGIVSEYVDTGRLRVAKAPLPLESIHKQAREAAAAAYCAGEQGKFWLMDEQLLWDREKLKARPWLDFAHYIALDQASFETCMSSGSYDDSLRYWKEVAEALQFTGTPSFVLAEADSADSSKVRVLDLWTGMRPFSEVKERIDGVLAGQSPQLQAQSLSFPGGRRLSLLAPGLLEDAGYEMSAEDELYLLASEYYVHQMLTPAMEVVVSWVMGRPGSELDIQGGVAALRNEIAQDEDLREIAYSQEDTVISGYEAVFAEIAYSVESMKLNATKRAVVFIDVSGDAPQTWLVIVLFFTDNPLADGLATRILQSVEMSPNAP